MGRRPAVVAPIAPWRHVSALLKAEAGAIPSEGGHALAVVLAIGLLLAAVGTRRAATAEPQPGTAAAAAANDQAGFTPLAKAVRRFNELAQQDKVGKAQPPLTVDEVVAAIRLKSDADFGDIPGAAIEAYRQIAASEKLPTGASLDFTTGVSWQRSEKEIVEIDMWGIILEIRSSDWGRREMIRTQAIKSRVTVIPPLERPVVSGKDAADLARRYEVRWGQADHGFQVGLAALDDRRKLAPGDRLPVEFFLRYSGDKPLAIEYRAEFQTSWQGTTAVYSEKDKRDINVEFLRILLISPRNQHTFEPGEIVAFKHPGLGIGGQNTPYIEDPAPGRYSVRESLSVTLEAGADPKDLSLTTAPIDFEVVAPSDVPAGP